MKHQVSFLLSVKPVGDPYSENIFFFNVNKRGQVLKESACAFGKLSGSCAFFLPTYVH